MTTLRILDRDYEVRPLNEVERMGWHLHVRRVFAGLHWEELYESIKGLPDHLQQTVVSRCPLPDRIDRLSYWAVATRPAAVRKLVSMMVPDLESPVTPDNAADIFWALHPLILNEPVEFSGADGLAILRRQPPRAAEPPGDVVGPTRPSAAGGH